MVDNVIVDRVAGHEGVDLVLTEGTECLVTDVVGVVHGRQLHSTLPPQLPSEIPIGQYKQMSAVADRAYC